MVSLQASTKMVFPQNKGGPNIDPKILQSFLGAPKATPNFGRPHMSLPAECERHVESLDTGCPWETCGICLPAHESQVLSRE